MNKLELIAAVSEKSGLTKKDSEAAISAIIEAITEALEKQDKVQLIGFGTFEIKKRAERNGVNPSTGEKIKISASKVPVFKPGKPLKEKVAK